MFQPAINHQSNKLNLATCILGDIISCGYLLTDWISKLDTYYTFFPLGVDGKVVMDS